MSFSLLSSKGGWGERLFLQDRLSGLQADLAQQESYNAVLREHLDSLYSSQHAIETVARYRLGMIQQGEIFVQFLIERPEQVSSTPAESSIEQPIESPLPFNPIE
ncbi:FtsB family cell division protein [Thiomicrospira aerophila]|nr:septum formation initiator family protein [Thiomicrospira aerophila]